MSYREEKIKSLIGSDYTDFNTRKLQDHCSSILERGMHGLCFSPYEGIQKPGDEISEDQIRRRLEIIKPYTKWIRTFSCTDGNELIPKLAKEYGIKTLVGAWLSDNENTNADEIRSLISLCDSGLVDIAAVGNEVMYRGDLSEDQLLNYIHEVKSAVKGIPVGYVDAYYEFNTRPKISAACDVILANCYPYWEGCHLDYSLLYMKQMYQAALDAADGKKVIITETGWPSQGSDLGDAHPSYENALKYFSNAQQWAEEEEIEMFYFSSFDESWKVDSEGDVGAFWGLWDKEEKIKF